MHNILTLKLPDKNALFRSYMPFIKGGGLFLPSNKRYKIGEEVFVMVTLPDEEEKRPIAGKIVWLTPAGGGPARPQGVGIQFMDNPVSEMLRNRIDVLLAGMSEDDKTTYTM